MQMSRPILSLAAVNRTIVRSVAVDSASLNADEGTQKGKPWQEIPGPPSLPIIGILHNFLKPKSPLNDFKTINEYLYNTYGNIVKFEGVFGSPTHIFIYDAESAATIHRGENLMPLRPGLPSLEYFRKHYNKTKEESLRPTGLITDHGDNWKKFRTTVNPIMLQPKTIKLYAPVLDEVAKDMIARMRTMRNEKNMLEGKFDLEMNLWSLESVGVVAFGGRLNCFDPNLAEDSRERQLIRCVHDLFNISTELDFKPNLWRYISTPLFKKAMKLYQEHQDLARYFVRRAMEDLKNKSKSDDEKGVLEKLLEIDEEVAVIMACDMLLAGVDTTATTITGTLYLLASNPEKQKKLREELKSGQEQRPYLKACFKESLRVMPIVSGILRETTKEYNNILGYNIPKGMRVYFGHKYLSQMEKEFPRPMEYIPERWIEKDSPIYYNQAHPFAYSPFGYGVRSCMGRRIAELEMETFLAQIIQNFEVEWFGPPIKINPTSMNYCAEPFNFIFKDI